MTTTDSNGIIFLEETDPISPFHTLMNGMQQGTSDAITTARRGPLYAADATERGNLYTLYGASATEPLWVDMAGVLYRTTNGTTWTLVRPGYTRGYFQAATDSNGFASFNHGLGTSPVAVTATMGRGGTAESTLLVATPVLWEVTTTNVVMRIRRDDTHGWFNGSVGFSWVAYA